MIIKTKWLCDHLTYIRILVHFLTNNKELTPNQIIHALRDSIGITRRQGDNIMFIILTVLAIISISAIVMLIFYKDGRYGSLGEGSDIVYSLYGRICVCAYTAKGFNK